MDIIRFDSRTHQTKPRPASESLASFWGWNLYPGLIEFDGEILAT
jgi:hypothetical protein